MNLEIQYPEEPFAQLTTFNQSKNNTLKHHDRMRNDRIPLNQYCTWNQRSKFVFLKTTKRTHLFRTFLRLNFYFCSNEKKRI